ncbi:transposase [Clostridium grantii]|uniref:Transposase n=1 Tax=Clostridium grantii DSM 8605 TaxID=1121316 RepID=A0A1M5Y4M0_9CLOT|nr:transposase [Clostridium grantii]SHI06754.1 Transposase [Clostridium grantii DSM 8605]
MGRKQLEIISLHGEKIEEFIELKNNTNSKYVRLVLTTVTMRYLGSNTKDIMFATGLSNPTIVNHIANSILNDFHVVNDVYSSKDPITSEQIKNHIEYLLELNPDKKVVVFMDNAKTHTSKTMQYFYSSNKDKLQIILLPRYSPEMNPQEHIWRSLKAKLFRPSSRTSIYELLYDINNIFNELNSNKDEICSLAYAKNYLV